MTVRWQYLADLLERTVRTFIQAYLGYWLSLGGANYDTLFTINNLKVAVAAAALAVATAVVGKGVGDHSSASVLPPPGAPAVVVESTATPPGPTRAGFSFDESRRQHLDDILAQLNRLPADRVAPPPPPVKLTDEVPPPPVREPLGVLIDPYGVGGRDPTSDGNR